MDSTNPIANYAASLDAGMNSVRPEKDDGTISRLPDGPYIAKVVEATLAPSTAQNAGKTVKLTIKLEVLAPDEVAGRKAKGRFIWKGHNMTDQDGKNRPDNIARALADLETLGLKVYGTPSPVGTFMANRGQLVGIVAKVTLRTAKKSDYQNCFIESRATEAEIPGLALAAAVGHGNGSTAGAGFDGSGGGGDGTSASPFDSAAAEPNVEVPF
jgi:hypothetical protein